MDDYSQRRQFWVSQLANEMGRERLAKRLGYTDTNYLNQVVRGHSKLGNPNAKKWAKALGLEPGWFDRPLPPADDQEEVPTAIETEFTALISSVSDRGQMIAVMKAAENLSPKDSIRLARFLLIRAEAGL